MLADKAESKTRPYLVLAEQSADPLGLVDPQQRMWPLACCAVPVQIKLRRPSLLNVTHQAFHKRVLPEEAGQSCPKTAWPQYIQDIYHPAKGYEPLPLLCPVHPT